MEKMFGKGFIGHKLSDKQPLVTFATTAEQISHSLTPQLTDGPSFLEELARVRPGHSSETLDSNLLLVLEFASVDDVRSLFTVLRYDVLDGETTSG